MTESDEAQLLLIVVGAHLRAEVADRPLGYQLRQRILDWLAEHESLLNVAIEPIVCSDVWYVNQSELQRYPSISLGGPGVNALTAFFGQKLPESVMRDENTVIMMDPDYVDLRVCIWGMDHDLTVIALETFVDMYLDGYLRAVATQVVPDD